MRLSENFVESFKKRHSVILGMTRSGKTFFAGRILERLQNQGVHTLFVDPKHDKDYEHLGTLCYSTMEVLEQIMLKKRSIVFRPPASKEQKIEQLDEVIELLFKFSKEDGYKRIRRVVAIDELQLFVKKGNSKAIEMIWTVGAGIGIVGMALTQRVQLLNETAWSQSDNKVLFKMEDRPEYLRTRNLDHYVDNMDKLQDPNKWLLRDPIPLQNTNAWDGNLSLSPY